MNFLTVGLGYVSRRLDEVYWGVAYCVQTSVNTRANWRSIASRMRFSGSDLAGLVWFEIEIPMVKLLRAHGGCLGIERR